MGYRGRMKLEKYPLHPACAVWPAMEPAKLAELVEDIRRRGLIMPGVVTREGELLAGKNRQAACAVAGVGFRVTTYLGDDPEGFTISENKHRQHYTPGQLALIGEELAKLKAGNPNFSRERNKERTQREVAADLGINENLISDARRLKRTGTPEVIELVRQNKVGIKSAAAYTRHTRKGDQVADPKIIKVEGKKLRSPKRHAFENPTGPDKEPMVPVAEVRKRFLPLFKRVKQQALVNHVAYISRTELRMIASEGKRTLKAWAEGNLEVRRISPHLVEPTGPADEEDD